MQISSLENQNRHVVQTLQTLQTLQIFQVLEYDHDISVSPYFAMNEYCMGHVNTRKRQFVAHMNGQDSAVLQAGAMQYTVGYVNIKTGIKSAGDFIGKAVKGVVTKESAVKPECTGNGLLVLEPTYKHIVLVDMNAWQSGIVVEDGMFLASSGSLQHQVVARQNVSSALFGGEGLFDMQFQGKGVLALESVVPADELIVSTHASRYMGCNSLYVEKEYLF